MEEGRLSPLPFSRGQLPVLKHRLAPSYYTAVLLSNIPAEKTELGIFSIYWPERILHWRHLQCGLCNMAAAPLENPLAELKHFLGEAQTIAFSVPLCCLIFSFVSSPDLCSRYLRYLQIQVSRSGCPCSPQTTANQLLLWGLFYLGRYEPNMSWEKFYLYAFPDVSVCELRSLYFCRGLMTCLKHLHVSH